MGNIGEPVDNIIGALSRVLHGFRGASLNTVGDLGPYLDLPTDELFPAPVVPRDMVRTPQRLSFGPRVIETLRWHSQHVVMCPHYRARHANEYLVNQRVVARWIHPRGRERDRALIYVHGWLEPGPWVEEASFLPRISEELDVDVLHVQLPFHGSRNPRSALFHGEFFWSADLVRTIEAVRQSVLDVRTLMAWLKHPRKDGRHYRQVGVTGLSLGGSITMVLACVAPTPDYIMPIIAHTQLEEALEEASILWRMREDLERFGVTRKQRSELFRRLGLSTMRPKLVPNRQLWFPAREDQYITSRLVERQWRDWGEPPIEWLPGGHMTFPLQVARMITRMKEFHQTLSR